jgi:hypothetical protein
MEAWRLKMKPWRVWRPVVADSFHLEEGWFQIRIRKKLKSWIRIRISSSRKAFFRIEVLNICRFSGSLISCELLLIGDM